MLSRSTADPAHNPAPPCQHNHSSPSHALSDSESSEPPICPSEQQSALPSQCWGTHETHGRAAFNAKARRRVIATSSMQRMKSPASGDQRPRRGSIVMDAKTANPTAKAGGGSAHWHECQDYPTPQVRHVSCKPQRCGMCQTTPKILHMSQTANQSGGKTIRSMTEGQCIAVRQAALLQRGSTVPLPL